MRKLSEFLVLTTLCLFGASLLSAQTEPSEEALEAINEAIAEVQAEITRRNSQRASVYQELQEAEKSLSSLTSEITRLEAAIAEQENELSSLRQQQSTLLAEKNSQQALIGQYLRSAYVNGRQEYFKLLLNQEDPALASRAMRYYRYFNDARSEKVEQYSATLRELAVVETRIAETTAAMNSQKENLARQQESLETRQDERQALLDDIDVILTRSGTRLESLEAERTEMELLIEELRRSIANLSLGQQQQPFVNLKGSLPWPVAGSVKNRWGGKIGLGDLNWQGVTLTAGKGSDVRAIHHGRVVYSDWFSNSGLLLIIDHGDGYMSLYAHNQELYKDVGEWVNSGEIIAAVGNTGGQDDYGLYFEIRHNGESENPSTWCLARN